MTTSGSYTIHTFTTTTSPSTFTVQASLDQSIAFGALANKTYGDAPFTVSATASSGFSASFSIVSGPATISGNTVTITGAGTVRVRASQTGGTADNTIYYVAATSVDQDFTVAKATPTISAAPSASDITYGQTLASSTLTGGTASVAGAFAFTSPSTTPNAGTAAQGVTFTPTDTTNYNTTTTSASVAVAKVTPTISAAPTAGGITYGQTLASSTLSGGTASVGGTFTFTTPSTTPGVGTATQGVTFTPSDTTNYNSTTTTVDVTVAKATPTISVAPSASGITYGQTLASSILSGGSASVAGSFAFTTPGTAPNAGTAGQGVTFTPSDTTNYNTTTTSASVAVAKVTPTISAAPTASSITYGQTLASSTLSGGAASVGGTFGFTASSSVPGVGSAAQGVTFTPSDTTNYNNATTTTSVTVAKATPTISAAPSASGITYGQSLASSNLSGGSASVAGAFAFTSPSTSPNAGTTTQGVTFTPTDTTNYNTTTTSASVAVAKVTPTISAAPTASGITYGQTLASSSLSGGTASVAGTFAFTTPGTAPNAGTAAQGVTFTPTDSTNYNTTTTTVNIVVAKATPTISAAPIASGITYGQTLTSSMLTGGTASVAGTFAFTTPSTAPNAGTTAQGVTFTPSSTTNYNTATSIANVSVAKAAPTITWANPSAITYGTRLSAIQLNATSSAAGSFVYSPLSGTTPNAGTQTLSATFTPSDTANYNTASSTVLLVVNKAVPTVTWATPGAITYGTALSATQLNASGSVAGSLVYSPASGTTPNAGTQTLTATFTPSDAVNYDTATGTVSLVVGQATPTLTWASPSAVIYGTALSSAQLNASSGGVAGSFIYSPSSGTILSVGTQALTASFTPSDTANYTSTTRTVALIVGKATPSITWTPPSAINYGMALSETQLNATASVAGSFTYNPSIGTILGLGTQTLSATFTPTDATNYNSATSAVALNVNVALPSAPSAVYATTTNGEATVSFNAPSFTGGATITSYTIRATASDGAIVSVTALGSPAKVTGLTPGKSYRFTVTANNSAGASESSEASDAITISLFDQTITFATPADRPSNSGSFVLKATASSGLPVSFTILSGPAMLLGNTVDLTGAHGPVKIRASQPGNERFAAAPEVEVTFVVTGGATRVIFSKAIKSSTQTYEADLAFVLNTGSRRSTLMIVSNSSSGVRGVVDLQLSTLGMFSVNIPAIAAGTSSSPAAGSNSSASQASYTITGSLVDNVLTGTVEPLGLTFRQTIAPVTTTTSAIGCYDASALLEDRGEIYATVGANNEVLVLAEAGDLYVGGYTTLKADNTYTLVTALSAGNVTINGEINPVTTVMKARLTLPTNQVVTYSGLNMATVNTDRLINLSSRAKVGSGEAVLITGFVVGGPEPKRVLVRAAGPALGAFGLNNTLSNPAIKIYQGSRLIAENDDWNPADAAEMASLGAFPLISIRSKDTQSADAALITTLAPGAYTAQISDSSGAVEGAGVALAEIYDASVNPNADYQRLVNISSRGKVTPDDGVLIGGFIVTGNHPKRLLIRGIGPALTHFGIAGVLTDPSLTIYQDGKAIANNEGWANRADITAAAAQTGAFALPSGSKDAAVLITLSPGAYTAQIKSAKNNSSGVALIEIYEVSY